MRSSGLPASRSTIRSIARLHLGGRLGLGDVARGAGGCGRGSSSSLAHRQLHPVDAARAPFDAADADRACRTRQNAGRSWLAPKSHRPMFRSDAESRLGNSCDPPGFRESCTGWFHPCLPFPRAPMQTLHVNGYDMAYLDVGQARAPPLVCVHGSLNDFRIWGCVLGPLTTQHRADLRQPAAFLPRAVGRQRRHLFDRAACRRPDRLHRKARYGPGRPDGPFPRRAHLASASRSGGPTCCAG